MTIQPALITSKNNISFTIRAVLLTASSLTVMSGAIIAPALPAINQNFAEAPELLTKLILTMPAVSIALLAPVAGYLTDRFGRKRLLVISLIIYGIAGTSGFFIDTIEWLLISRAVLGVAVAGVMNAATTLIGDYFEGVERNKFKGIQASFMALGGVAYLNMGGMLADWSWRGPFLVYGLAFIILPFALSAIFEPPFHEAKKSDLSLPLPNKGLLAFIYFIGFLGMTFFYMIPVQIPFLLSNLEISNSLIGLAISVSTVTGAIASMNYARIKSYLSYQRIYSLSFGLMAVGYVVISFSSTYWLVMAGLAIGGLGTGLIMPNGNLWLMQSVSEQHRGQAIGGMTSAIFLGQFLSPILISPVVNIFEISNAFLIVGITILLVSLTLFFLGTGFRSD